MRKIAAAVVAIGLFLGVSISAGQLQFEAGAGEGGAAVGGIPIQRLNAGAGDGGGCV